MNIKEQLYITTLARHKNISRACEELYITQPALSIFLRNLEKQLDVQLFERKGKILQPTYIGERYIEKAKKMLDLQEEFLTELADVKVGIGGKIRIAVQKRRAPNILPQIMSEFKRTYPGVKIEIYDANDSELWDFFLNDKVDFLITMKNEFGIEDVISHCLCTEKILVALHPSSPANALAKPLEGCKYKYIDIKDIKDEHFLLQGTSQSLRRASDLAFKRAGVRPKSYEVIRTIETAMLCTGENMGISFNREGYIMFMSGVNNVNFYAIGNPPMENDILLSYKKDLVITEYMQKFIEVVSHNVKKIYD